MLTQVTLRRVDLRKITTEIYKTVQHRLAGSQLDYNRIEVGSAYGNLIIKFASGP